MSSDLHHLEPLAQRFPLDDRAGPYRFEPARAQRIVSQALDAWSKERSRPQTRRRRRGVVVGLATAAIASAAAATTWYSVTAPVPDEQAAPVASATAARARPEPNRTPAPPESEEPPPNEPAAAPAADPGPRGHARERRARGTARDVEDLLRRANQLRARGQWRRAERAYRKVMRRRHGSMSAYVASVAAASLRVEQLDDPRGALRLYRRAMRLRSDGPLDVEVREGVARAWRGLGNRARERAALSELLARHERGPAVARARKRLESLSGAGAL